MFTWPTVIYNGIIRRIVKHVSYQLTFVIIISFFYSLWSVGHPWRASKRCDLSYPLDLIPWSSCCIFLFHPLLSFTTFSLAYLFFCTPEDSNPMQFSLLLLLLYVMCSIFFIYLNFYWFLFGDSPQFFTNFQVYFIYFAFSFSIYVCKAICSICILL